MSVDVPIDTQTYPVAEVAGREPQRLADFLGATTVRFGADEGASQLVGTGVHDGRAVLFRERQLSSAEPDGWVWTIVDIGNGEFRAEPHHDR